MIFLFIGGAEIFIIGLIVVLFFGTDKLPEIARGLGKGMRDIKNATNDIKNEIKDTGIENNIVDDIKKEVNLAKESINDITQPINENYKTDNINNIEEVKEGNKEDTSTNTEFNKSTVDEVSESIKRKK